MLPPAPEGGGIQSGLIAGGVGSDRATEVIIYLQNHIPHETLHHGRLVVESFGQWRPVLRFWPHSTGRLSDFAIRLQPYCSLILENAPSCPGGAEKGDGYVFISFNDSVFFDGNSSVLRPDGKAVLDTIIPALVEASPYIDELKVLGHTAQMYADRRAVPGPRPPHCCRREWGCFYLPSRR